MMKNPNKKNISAVLFLSTVSFTAPSVQSLAADNCFAAGQQYAARQAATLVAAQVEAQGGKEVCKVVILTQAANGERPKRKVVYIPQ